MEQWLSDGVARRTRRKSAAARRRNGTQIALLDTLLLLTRDQPLGLPLWQGRPRPRGLAHAPLLRDKARASRLKGPRGTRAVGHLIRSGGWTRCNPATPTRGANVRPLPCARPTLSAKRLRGIRPGDGGWAKNSAIVVTLAGDRDACHVTIVDSGLVRQVHRQSHCH
eukprot:6197692-Pleurochrysis_carterae.AAC.2